MIMMMTYWTIYVFGHQVCLVRSNMALVRLLLDAAGWRERMKSSKYLCITVLRMPRQYKTFYICILLREWYSDGFSGKAFFLRVIVLFPFGVLSTAKAPALFHRQANGRASRRVWKKSPSTRTIIIILIKHSRYRARTFCQRFATFYAGRRATATAAAPAIT